MANRISVSQQETLVNFMEQGDLSNPTKGSNAQLDGKHTASLKWECLASMLNADETGATRSIEKWKKAWSDMKNNIKKKAGKINKAASGTGGGPACTLKLSDLEIRVLNIMGLRAVTGIEEIEENGLPKRTTAEQSHPYNSSSIEELFTVRGQEFHILNKELENIVDPMQEIQTDNDSMQNQPSTMREYLTQPSPNPISPEHRSHQSSPIPTTPEHINRRISPTPHIPKKRKLSMADEAAQRFLAADSEYRSFIKEKHRDNIFIEREKIRIREAELKVRQLELEVSKGLQQIGLRCMEIAEKIADKYL